MQKEVIQQLQIFQQAMEYKDTNNLMINKKYSRKRR